MFDRPDSVFFDGPPPAPSTQVAFTFAHHDHGRALYLCTPLSPWPPSHSAGAAVPFLGVSYFSLKAFFPVPLYPRDAVCSPLQSPPAQKMVGSPPGFGKMLNPLVFFGKVPGFLAGPPLSPAPFPKPPSSCQGGVTWLIRLCGRRVSLLFFSLEEKWVPLGARPHFFLSEAVYLACLFFPLLLLPGPFLCPRVFDMFPGFF